jgi:hypothetical protein
VGKKYLRTDKKQCEFLGLEEIKIQERKGWAPKFMHPEGSAVLHSWNGTVWVPGQAFAPRLQDDPLAVCETDEGPVPGCC